MFDLSSTAIVVVNYGSSGLLESNLIGVSEEAPDATVVVVDNFTSVSEQDQVTRLCVQNNWHPVLLPSNSGFGAGVNAGAREAIRMGVRVLLVLNPDASIRRASVERLARAVTDDATLMTAPVIRRSDGSLWFNGSDVALDVGQMQKPAMRAHSSASGYRAWLTGACFAISVDLWQSLGGFDTDYFLYWEDVDLSYRVTASGGHLVVDLEAEAIHDAGGTQVAPTQGRAKSEVYYYYNIRNRLMYAAKTLDEAGVRRWLRATMRASYLVILRGGRRQLLHPLMPTRAMIRGVRDGRQFVRNSRKMS